MKTEMSNGERFGCLLGSAIPAAAAIVTIFSRDVAVWVPYLFFGITLIILIGVIRSGDKPKKPVEVEYVDLKDFKG